VEPHAGLGAIVPGAKVAAIGRRPARSVRESPSRQSASLLTVGLRQLIAILVRQGKCGSTISSSSCGRGSRRAISIAVSAYWERTILTPRKSDTFKKLGG